MNTLGEQSAAIGEIISGVIPADNLRAHMQVLALTAAMALKAFEPNVPGGRAKPDVWSNWPDFSKRMTQFAQKTLAGAKVTDSDAALTAMADVSDDCKNCHDTYRGEEKK